jgi:hypothetical protein
MSDVLQPRARQLLLVVLAGLLLAIVPALSAAAAPRPNERAKPIVINFDDLEGELGEIFTAMCGFPVSVDAVGWVKIIPINAAGKGKRQPLELNIYHLPSVTYSSGDRSFTTPLDVGPDVIYLQDGVVYVALTGRSTTGSGVIGRVVINTETGDVVFEAGQRVYEDFAAHVCEELAPAA